MSKRHLVVLGFAAAMIWCAGPSGALAQPRPPVPLAPRMHSGPTMMSARAHTLKEKVAGEIAKAKAGGADVSAAEKHKTEGDAALAAGHYRIAVEHYEAAEKAMPK